MKRLFSLPLLALLLALSLAQTAAAEIPSMNVKNARLEAGSAASGLRSALRQAGSGSREPYWVAWSVPMVEGERYACCFGKNYGATTCMLEGKNEGWGDSDPEGSARKPDQKLIVLLRMEGGQVDQIRAFSESCPLDAGKRRFVWLGAAKPEESVAVVADLAEDKDRSHEEASNAFAALALHRNSGADAALEKLASAPRTAKERNHRSSGSASAAARAASTSSPLSRLPTRRRTSARGSLQPEPEPAPRGGRERSRSGPEQQERQGARPCPVLPLADRLPEGRARDPRSHQDRSGGVDAQAGHLRLSQLRGGQGTAMLIQLGRETEDQEIRREVIFWLSQSKDPAAVAFIDKFLED